MSIGIIIILVLDLCVAAAFWRGLKLSGIEWRWPVVFAGIVGLQAALVGVMMLGHRLGWGLGHGHGGSGVAVGGVVAAIAANRLRSRRATAISGRRLAVAFGTVLALHVVVIAGMLTLRHLHSV